MKKLKICLSIFLAASTVALFTACNQSTVSESMSDMSGNVNRNSSETDIGNVISSANISQKNSQASELSENCKTVYASIKSGAVNNNESKCSDGSNVDFAAPKDASEEEKNLAAKNVKISDILRYCGLSIDVSDDFYYYDDENTIYKGDIIYLDDSVPTKYDIKKFVKLTKDTTLQELYNL